MLANPLAITLQEEGELVPGWTGIELPLLSDGSIHFWTAAEQIPISRTLPISESMTIDSAAFSREGSLLATASPGNLLTLWRLQPDGLVVPLDTLEGDPSEELSALVFNQAGTMLTPLFADHPHPSKRLATRPDWNRPSRRMRSSRARLRFQRFRNKH